MFLGLELFRLIFLCGALLQVLFVLVKCLESFFPGFIKLPRAGKLLFIQAQVGALLVIVSTYYYKDLVLFLGQILVLFLFRQQARPRYREKNNTKSLEA